MAEFNKIQDVFGENPPIPPRQPTAKPKPPYYQEVAFKPAKPPRSGYNCSLAKFPTYIENPEKVIIRKKKIEGQDDDPAAPPFKITYKKRTRPTPSVATNLRNLKASFPSAFRK